MADPDLGADSPAAEDSQPAGGGPPVAVNPSAIPDCRQCGSCCGPFFALYVEEPDEERWTKEGRQDLLDRLEWERNRVRWDSAGPYDVETGERFERCVWRVNLPDGRVVCGIHSTKPRICLDYPPGSSELCAIYRDRRKAQPRRS